MKFPEHEKLKDRRHEHLHIEKFCRFLQRKGVLTKSVEGENPGEEIYFTMGDNDVSKLISEYFDIDPEKFEQEKRKMLESIRNNN